MADFLDLLQWPAMAVTLLASWMLAAKQAHRRMIGFVLFVLSNLLWIAWGWGDDAYALIALQVGLIVLNVRGIMKNEEA